MQALVSRLEIRALILIVIAAAISAPFLPNHLKLSAAYYFGMYAVPVVVAAGLGWLAYSKKVFLWAAGGLLALTIVVHAFNVFVVVPSEDKHSPRTRSLIEFSR